MERAFVHLGARSEHSAGESLARVEALCRAAARHRMESLAITDMMSLASAPAFAVAARQAGLRAIHGLDCRVLNPRTASTEYDRVKLLAATEAGWRRLVQLVNLGAARTFPHVTWEELFAAPEGLLYLPGGSQGTLVAASAAKRLDEVEVLMNGFLDRVPHEQLFVALPNPAARNGARIAKLLQTIADHFELPTVAVPDVLCAFPEDDIALEFMARGALGELEAKTPLLELVRPHDERSYLAPGDVVRSAYRAHPHAVENAIDVAAMCSLELPHAPRRYPVHEYQRGVDAESFIWNEVFSRAADRYGDLPSRWRERLNREFHELVDADLPDALVCLARFDEELAERGILRGPGAGFLTNSLVASLLGVTRIDPLTFDLPFSLPESAKSKASLLELCVPASRFEEAGEALANRFRGHIAAIGKWKTWSAAQAFEWIQEQFQGDEPAGLLRSPEWQQANDHAAPEGQDPPLDWKLGEVKTLAWLTRRFEGRPRGIRSAGTEWVFSAEPLSRSIPCSFVEDREIAQWDSETLAALGYGRIALKRDGMLDLLDEGAAWVREQGRRTFDPLAIAAEGDPATFKLLREGKTQGIALLEPPSVKMRLRQLQPSDMHSLLRGLNTGADPGKLSDSWFERVLLAVACATLKAQENVAFYAAALSQFTGEPRRMLPLLHEAACEGLTLRMVDINCSVWRWAPEGTSLRPGFMVVNGMSHAAAKEIEQARREMTFADLTDLLRRTDPRALKTAHVEALIRAGALDSVGTSRSAMLAKLPQLDELLRPTTRRGTVSDPLAFFGQGTEWWLEHLVDEQQFAQAGGDERLEWLVEQERELTGLCLSVEPTFFVREFLRAAHVLAPMQLKPRDRDQVRCLLSPIYAIENPELKNADICLLDMGGVIVQAKGAVAREAQRLAKDADSVIVTGKLHRDQFQWVIEAESLVALDEAARLGTGAQTLEINAPLLTQKELKTLLGILKDYKGNTPVTVNGMGEEKNRLAQKIASRKITWCPGLEIALRQVIEPTCWRLTIKGAESARAKAIRKAAA